MSSFSGEPPRKTNQPPSSPSSFFSPLPEDLVLEILARVPRRYHPIISCVSKNFEKLVRSPEIQKTRSLLKLDSLYICFNDISERCGTNRHWYTLRRINNDPIEDVFGAIEIPSPPILNYSSVIAIDHEIFFVSGSKVPSSSFLIFDSRSKTFREGPNMLLKRYYSGAGLVGEKIYAIGGYKDYGEIEAESFDLKKQIWEIAPFPDLEGSTRWLCATNVSLDRKIYSLCVFHGVTCYDPRDGSCECFELLDDEWWKCGVCVIQNVLYVYFARFGLMWFDTELVSWRIVDGLSDMKKVWSVGMAEYYGKMAFLWEYLGEVNGESKEIWCRMIGLVRSEGGIQGIAEPAQLLGTVPYNYILQHCLSLSD